ncbi:Replicative DNA helicase [Poriferisphaera corsica]|uniref:Replicative DNA helicase n=1 Tax=Poriferisphaera corsica TaxID=2528020 RepID=A0A517YVR5_9BACT|nr:replicative DNA helicase [Poriferisphaera corsica]QDU34306.1 Replicative DNA helicase [Poriferisphaera corsica]
MIAPTKDNQRDRSFNNARSNRNTNDPLGRKLPQAIEAEAAVLGSMILDDRICGDVLERLSPEPHAKFLKESHQIIFKVLIELYDKTQSIDMVQINQKLVDAEMLERVGGLDYLMELAESVPSAVNAVYYAEIVKAKATDRAIIEASHQTIEDVYANNEGDINLLDRAESRIYKIAESNESVTTTECVSEVIQREYDRITSGGLENQGIKTGYFELDDMTNGLQPGEMIIAAARPSMGKTAFAINVCENIGITDKTPCAVFSLEMGRGQLATRMLSSQSGVCSHAIRRNTLSNDNYDSLLKATAQISEAPIYIDDEPGLTLLSMRSKARRLKARHGIKLVMIDYLQLMTAPGHNSRQEEVSAISRGVKALARELNVPVICLSQLNRGSEGREGHKPRMSDLRESGSIEQDADVVMMLHREDYYHRGDEGYDPDNTAELIICKQRNGPTGTVKLHFDGSTTRFNNLATNHQQRQGGRPW